METQNQKSGAALDKKFSLKHNENAERQKKACHGGNRGRASSWKIDGLQ